MRNFVETDVDDVMKLFRVFNDATHGDAGALDLNALRALKQRVEGAIRFLSAIVRPTTWASTARPWDAQLGMVAGTRC